MAKDKLTDYDTTASGNTDVGGINIQGTAMISTVDNALREFMSHLAETNAGTYPVDDTWTFCDPADKTKKFRFDGVGITAGQTRVLTVPDASGTLSLNDFAQTVSAVKTFSAIPVLSGGAITFPGTQVPSAGANTLDDYEEGTFTPGFSASGATFSYSTQTGEYIKIGKLVFVHIDIRLNTSGNTLTANPLTVTGLPFTVGSYNYRASVITWVNSTTSYVLCLADFALGATTLVPRGITAAATANNANVNSDALLHATNGSIVIFGGTYIASA